MEEGNKVVEFKKEETTKEKMLHEIEKLIKVNDLLLDNLSKSINTKELVHELRENIIVYTQLLNQIEMRK